MINGDDGKPLNVELFGHSECNCWGVMLTDKGIVFAKKCEEK